MGGVDIANQLRATYSAHDRKAEKVLESSFPVAAGPLPPQPVQIGLFWLVEWDDIHQGLPETDDVEVRVNYKVPGYFANMNTANPGDRITNSYLIS
jgi:hypothetical protein